MVSKNLVAALPVIIALLMIGSGIVLTINNAAPHARQELVSSEVFNMPANETTYRQVTLNSSGDYHFVVNVANGAILSDILPEDSFDKWIHGQFNVSWNANQNAHNIYDLPGFSRLYQIEVSENTTSITEYLDDNTTSDNGYMVFWNPEPFSQEVTFRINQLWSETDSFSFNMGLFLTVAGAITMIAVILLFVLKHKSQIREFNKALENKE